MLDIRVSQSVHTKSLDLGLITEFVQMRVIGTVFCGFSGAVIDTPNLLCRDIGSLLSGDPHIPEFETTVLIFCGCDVLRSTILTHRMHRLSSSSKTGPLP